MMLNYLKFVHFLTRNTIQSVYKHSEASSLFFSPIFPIFRSHDPLLRRRGLRGGFTQEIGRVGSQRGGQKRFYYFFNAMMTMATITIVFLCIFYS